MARSVAEGFEVFLKRLTPLESQRAAAAAHRPRVETSLKKQLTISTMWETGSFHHGTGVRHYSDVDVLASISGGKPGTSDTALAWVKSALKASFPTTVVRISRPAVVVEFASGDETWEVIPGFIKSVSGDKLVYDIPGPSSGWIDSAPKEHLDYVNECNAKAGVKGGTKKLARLTKAWKYYNNVPISSFYLEMRAAQHVAKQDSFICVWDLCWLLEDMESHKLAGMNDPKQASGRIYPCSSDAKKIDALSKLSTAATRARKALDAQQEGKIDTAFHYLDLLFGGKFPAATGWDVAAGRPRSPTARAGSECSGVCARERLIITRGQRSTLRLSVTPGRISRRPPGDRRPVSRCCPADDCLFTANRRDRRRGRADPGVGDVPEGGELREGPA